MRATLLFWAKLVFCYMELLKYCRNVANVKTFWYNEVVPKNRHPHLRLKHRRADAEHIRPETNPIQVSFRLEESIMKKLSKRFLTLAIACVMAMAMAVPAFADWQLRPDSMLTLSDNYLNIYRTSSSISMRNCPLSLYRTSAPGFDQNFTVNYTTYGGKSCMYLTRIENSKTYAINRSTESYGYGHKAIMWPLSDGKKDAAFKRPYSDPNGLVNLLNYNEGMCYTSDDPGALVYFAKGGSSAWFATGTPTL